MKGSFIHLALLTGLALAGCGAVASAQEQLFDRYGRPIPQTRLYPEQRPDYAPPQYYPQRPAYEYRQPPAYDPYAPPRRQSRFQQGNICATQYGTCELPGPMFVGKGCRCNVPGVGRVPGTAAIQ